MNETDAKYSAPRGELAGQLRSAFRAARNALLDFQRPEGFWEGELSPSALSTATAASALSVVSRAKHRRLVRRALDWLEANQCGDGGWGDSPESPSNVSTTMLAQAALLLAAGEGIPLKEKAVERAERYLDENTGRTPSQRCRALRESYGEDRTFAVPILVNCALASECDGAHVPDGAKIRWDDIPGLPFELACCPPSWLRRLRLHVVSYALPALIAVGRLLHARKRGGSFPRRLLRDLAAAPATRKLEAIQPPSGGFLEAVPLTSFVVMSLAAAGESESVVVRRGVAFLERTVRPDGAWSIDVNLSHWLTSHAVSALCAGGPALVPDADKVRRWILACQGKHPNVYTGAAPGGWSWTHLSGGVPDTDDTAAALLALRDLGIADGTDEAAARGLKWLMNLQNADGGWPTFCRGWGALAFDRSAPDLTAHALRAIAAWRDLSGPDGGRGTIARGLNYLRRTQRRDGSWVPLWFGSQRVSDFENPVFGTARVLRVYGALGMFDADEARRGVRFLLDARRPHGGWGAKADVPPTLEETALAVDALCDWRGIGAARHAAAAGARFLADEIARGGLARPAPIGLYFAKLWYSEKLYPIIWSVAALARALKSLSIGEAAKTVILAE